MLVLRGVLTGATWSLVLADQGIIYCDEKGQLSPTAVAAHPNGVELQEVLTEGVDCEILSWKMDIEEPGAALLISQALNSGQEMAMRTTEITAVAVLAGEIMFSRAAPPANALLTALWSTL